MTSKQFNKEFERTYIAGLVWQSGNSHIRLMAVCEGYVMARYRGCIPFVESYRDFKKRIADCKTN